MSADIILFRARKAPLTRREARLLERFRQLSPERQEVVARYAQYAADVPRGALQEAVEIVGWQPPEE